MKQENLVTQEQTFVRGKFIQELFYNEDNGYGVYLLEVEESVPAVEQTTVTIVGHFIRPQTEETYLCEGEWRKHPRFGQQFFTHFVKREMPTTTSSVVKYLSSGLFRGVGKKTAQKIVEALGDQALHRIYENPELLQNIEGVNQKQAASIQKGLSDYHALEEAMLFLYSLGFGSTLAMKILQLYKEDTIAHIRENPYRLTEEIEGIGFQKADEIARKQGIELDSPMRLKAGIYHALQESAYQKGHVYLAHEELLQQVALLLEQKRQLTLFSQEVLKVACNELVQQKKLMIDEDRYYLPKLYYAELHLSLTFKKMLLTPWEEEKETSISEWYRLLGELEEEREVVYAEHQREAIFQGLRSRVMILTGGPGTGKTTVIRGICEMFGKIHECSLDPDYYKEEDKPFPIRLVAPTGRAAKRMSEATGLPAMTIHRLLGWRGEFFEHDQDNPITGSLLIVDEFSMVDIQLAFQLFRSLPDEIQVILVGDQDQLPSVGPGQVLSHLLSVSSIPRVELKQVFRQEQHSSIIDLAHAMKTGSSPEDLLVPQADRRFFVSDVEQSLSIISQTYENAMRRGYEAFQVQVLAPMYKGPLGVDRINQEIQERMNPKHPGKKEFTWGEVTFRHGDKVLQLANHTEFPVYNGDMGLIIAVEADASAEDPILWVQFDQQEVPYRRKDISQLSHAYCCSIHKSQGSEFDIVILPIVPAYRRMLKRNLLYTGITRAKQYLILCGDPKAFSYGIEQSQAEHRNSQLRNLIEDY
ncbi:SF1B family DNA helicase RecD2 [Risungbinella massiliensis]|uniref:SF1B family DNA helicase RecD2 n=1 Tax=Risungbinella massiliensis TaxID=1329796 RepID=UPI0005CBEEF8|nr:ATP-dependent RecD-like DNA helicase [Risungbinella massiliensis]